MQRPKLHQRNTDTHKLEKTVVKIKIPKKKIIAYFSGRGEEEVLILF